MIIDEQNVILINFLNGSQKFINILVAYRSLGATYEESISLRVYDANIAARYNIFEICTHLGRTAESRKEAACYKSEGCLSQTPDHLLCADFQHDSLTDIYTHTDTHTPLLLRKSPRHPDLLLC